METVNLDAYFKRIGFSDIAKPDLTTLKKLELLHTRQIPFENLNPLLHLLVKLDLDSLQEKLVKNKHGGYCFEQNWLFYYVLNVIGFNVTPLSARVLWNSPDDAITPKTHMLLLVKIADTNYIADVGFGGQSLTAPLKFELNTTQKTPHENYRLLKKEECFLLQTEIKNEWKSMYRFTLTESFMIDYKVANWYTSTHPDSHFTKFLMVAKAGKNCRYVVNNNHFTTHKINAESNLKILKSAGEIKTVLNDVFQLKLPETENLEALLKKLCQKEEA